MRTVFASLMLAFFLSATVLAQRPGGERGSRGESEGGFRGGPGGGFPGGRGDSGGFRGRGGSRGGDSGRGGFNPTDMIRRFDRNGNNMIDPDEAQGPAQFFLQRLAQNNPKIDLSKPIPIDQLGAEINRIRGGGGESRNSSSGDSRSSDEPPLLVPDFSLASEPTPIEGFGATSSLFAVQVEERDVKEAEERLRRYDRDRDGQLSQEELRSGRWSDDPMQYDRNRDGKLSRSEMAIRYANRRVADEQRRAAGGDSSRSRFSGWGGDRGNSGGDRGDWGRGSSREEKAPEVDRFGDAKSYRARSVQDKTNGIKGLPDFFARSDANGDGQVLMSEFSSSWSEETLAEFQKFDLNRDGIITPRECLDAVEDGARAGGGTSTGSTRAASRTPKASSSSGGASGLHIAWAKRQIGKYDSNGDGQLTAKEWEQMIVPPDGADANGDGVITVEEYAKFRQKK